MVEPPLIRIKTLCSSLRTRERVSKTHKTSNFIYDFQSKEKNYKKAIYRQGKWLFPLPYSMWDLNHLWGKKVNLKILFLLPYSMWDLNSSIGKESQSKKNQIQELKENTIKNNLLHFLKWKITRIKILSSLLCSHHSLPLWKDSSSNLQNKT